jgi:hypothetical protein
MIKHIIEHKFPSNKISNIEDIPNFKNSMLSKQKKELIDKTNIININLNSKNHIKDTAKKQDIQFSYENEPKPPVFKDPYFKPKQKDTLFWCIYILKYGFANYNNVHNFGVSELEEKTKCLKYIDKNISTVKSCNFKVTNISFKEIKSELITEHVYTSFKALIAFICYFKFNIYIIHDSKKMYLKFSNEDNEINHILIKDQHHYKIMHSDVNNTELPKFLKNMYCLDHFDKPIKGIGNFKSQEIIDIATNIGINTTNKNKTQIYNEIRMLLIW